MMDRNKTQNSNLTTKIIQLTDGYNTIENEKTILSKKAWTEAWAMNDGWKGGSLSDALKKTGNMSWWTISMEGQDEILHELGINRYYDVEGHDCTNEILQLFKKIMEKFLTSPI